MRQYWCYWPVLLWMLFVTVVLWLMGMPWGNIIAINGIMLVVCFFQIEVSVRFEENPKNRFWRFWERVRCALTREEFKEPKV